MQLGECMALQGKPNGPSTQCHFCVDNQVAVAVARNILRYWIKALALKSLLTLQLRDNYQAKQVSLLISYVCHIRIMTGTSQLQIPVKQSYMDLIQSFILYICNTFCRQPKVTGYWKTDRNVTLGLFHFIGPTDIATLIHCPCTVALTYQVSQQASKKTDFTVTVDLLCVVGSLKLILIKHPSFNLKTYVIYILANESLKFLVETCYHPKQVGWQLYCIMQFVHGGEKLQMDEVLLIVHSSLTSVIF